VLMYGCADVPIYRCADVLMYRCADIPIYRCADLTMYDVRVGFELRTNKPVTAKNGSELFARHYFVCPKGALFHYRRAPPGGHNAFPETRCVHRALPHAIVMRPRWGQNVRSYFIESTVNGLGTTALSGALAR